MPTFTENWLHRGSREALAGLVRRVADVPGRIIEIGSWEGRSTIVIAANAAGRTVHAVDTWQGSPSDVSAQLAAQRDVHAQWRANIDEATEGNVVEHRMDWREYRMIYKTPIALLFIDAEHTYDEVTDTIDAFLPLVSPGGVVCGDDRHIEGVWRAAQERLPEVQGASALWWAQLPKEA